MDKTIFWFVVRWTPHNRMPQYVAGPYGNREDATGAARAAIMPGSVVTLMETAPQEALAELRASERMRQDIYQEQLANYNAVKRNALEDGMIEVSPGHFVRPTPTDPQ